MEMKNKTQISQNSISFDFSKNLKQYKDNVGPKAFHPSFDDD